MYTALFKSFSTHFQLLIFTPSHFSLTLSRLTSHFYAKCYHQRNRNGRLPGSPVAGCIRYRFLLFRRPDAVVGHKILKQFAEFAFGFLEVGFVDPEGIVGIETDDFEGHFSCIYMVKGLDFFAYKRCFPRRRIVRNWARRCSRSAGTVRRRRSWF